MVVCHCRVVNDRAVQEAVQAGARDVTTIGALCSAGTRCGGCVPALEALLDDLLGPTATTAAAA